MKKVRTLLFALTGAGNNALDVLARHELVDLLGVVTAKKARDDFPYYACQKLHDQAFALGVPVYEDLKLKEPNTIKLMRSLQVQLIIVSTFNQILPKNIISLPRLGVVNLHLSLLPRYRGATPTVWALINGETVTGVTDHFIENEDIDRGKIICQKTIPIDPDYTDGMLRQHLALLSESVLIESLEALLISKNPVFVKQNEENASYFPKRDIEDAIIDPEKPFLEIKNRIRAMTPYPGAILKWRGATIPSPRAEMDIFS